jgi:hypothetical protein
VSFRPRLVTIMEVQLCGMVHIPPITDVRTTRSSIVGKEYSLGKIIGLTFAS